MTATRNPTGASKRRSKAKASKSTPHRSTHRPSTRLSAIAVSPFTPYPHAAVSSLSLPNGSSLSPPASAIASSSYGDGSSYSLAGPWASDTDLGQEWSRYKFTQRLAGNLTTFDAQRRVVKRVKYPIDEDGSPHHPSDLRRLQDCGFMPALRCWHDIDARVFLCKKSDSQFQGHWVAGCGMTKPWEWCTYFQSITTLLSDDSDIEYEDYSGPNDVAIGTQRDDANGGTTTGSNATAARGGDVYVSSPASATSSSSKDAETVAKTLLDSPDVREMIDVDSDSEMEDEDRLSSSSDSLFSKDGHASYSASSSSLFNALGNEAELAPIKTKGKGKAASEYSGYSLPFPHAATASAAALHLWPPPSPDRLFSALGAPLVTTSAPSSSAMSADVTPTNMRSLMRLLSSKGVPAKEFWAWFWGCPVCDEVMFKDYAGGHECPSFLFQGDGDSDKENDAPMTGMNPIDRLSPLYNE